MVESLLAILGYTILLVIVVILLIIHVLDTRVSQISDWCDEVEGWED